jgi:small subunit ribosomal protein S1
MAETKKDSADNVEETKDVATEATQETTETPEVQEVAEETKAATEEVAQETPEVPEVAKETKEIVEEVADAENAEGDDDDADEDDIDSDDVIVLDEEAVVIPAHKLISEDSDDDSDEDEDPVDLTPDSPYMPLTESGEFDWSALENEKDSYSVEERESLDARYSDTLNLIAEKEVIPGKILSVGKKEVVINIGYKSEGVIAASEFRYNPDLKPGDEVPVFVEKQEDKYGQLVISHKTARLYSAWQNVNDALESDQIITGFVKCRTKGGLIVDVFGLEAFLPGSQIDVKPIRDYDIYVGKQMEFKVVKINQEFKNVVVSHKALIEAELEEQKKQIIGGLEKGQVLEGTVKNITSYGVFIDLGGVDGLVHITDLSWGRINHPEEVVELDQKINVVILDFDDDKKRIALGLKQLTEHPWDSLSDKLQVGDKVKGKVVVIADYGAFVEIQPGVEGLIHVSEMSWSQHLRSAQDFLAVGGEVDAEILTLDREERKMSLGMKQLIADPWTDIEGRYPVESKHKAKIRNFTNFGVFVELEEGIDGLIHISDLSWSKKVKHPSEFCNIGDEIDVVVLELDKDNRRLSLGHKQLEENPWEVFEKMFEEGSVHQGTVIRKEGNQFIIYLPQGVEGYCTAKHMKKEDGANLEIEEVAQFAVIEFNKNARRIVVSHLRTYEDPPEKKPVGKRPAAGGTSRAVKAVQDSLEKTTLGDLGGVLSDLKDSMENAEEPKAKKPAAKKAPKKDADDDDDAPKAAKKPKAKKAPSKKVDLSKEEDLDEE